MPEKRMDQALGEFRSALSLDPLSPIVNMNYAVTLVTAARYPEALVQFQKVIASEPNFGPPHYYLSHLYAMTGRFGDAIAEFQNRNPFLKVGECGDLTTTGSSLRIANRTGVPEL